MSAYRGPCLPRRPKESFQVGVVRSLPWKISLLYRAPMGAQQQLRAAYLPRLAKRFQVAMWLEAAAKVNRKKHGWEQGMQALRPVGTRALLLRSAGKRR